MDIGIAAVSTRLTQASHEARLGRVVDYIHDHLEEDIPFDCLAEVACLSPYHWHRIYTAMRGETIAATIRRLRLLRAADRLANSDLAIAIIAERAGYGSVDAFGRAFKEAYGLPPAAYRADGSHAAFKAANRRQDARGFPISLETLSPIRCAAVAHRGSYLQIDRAMDRLFSGLAAQQLMPPAPKMIAVFLDDPDLVAVDALRSQACVPLGDDVVPAPPLEETTLRGGLYARLRYKGPYADMKDAYRWLLGVWLPASGREADDAPVFEAYLNNPRDVPPTELLTDIHLPLRAS
jgi:AraC family transcriptional regulator